MKSWSVDYEIVIRGNVVLSGEDRAEVWDKLTYIMDDIIKSGEPELKRIEIEPYEEW